ncbi:MAG: SAM-dependent methyltransferase [Mycoplasma sp.]
MDHALKSASKSKSGNIGKPDFVAKVKDCLIVIECKANIKNHVKQDENSLIDFINDQTAIKNYAVNGALFYAAHLAKNTTFKKIFAIGVSGQEKIHKISPYFIDDRCEPKELKELETFFHFSEENIDEYYRTEVLDIKKDTEANIQKILEDAKKLNEYLRDYGNIENNKKPLIVSGILLALNEIEHHDFNIESLVGDTKITDGQKIYDAIENNLKRASVDPQTKKDKLLSQFSVIRDMVSINEIHRSLGKTPLKYFTEFIYNNIFKKIKNSETSEDYLGRFYGEFISFGGGDGQSLGIVLTPKHICDLFCDLVELKPTDRVIDPCCGTGGFLVAAMHYMLKRARKEEFLDIKRNNLHGIELQPFMFTIATTNMILRGDGKSNLFTDDFLKQNPSKLQRDKHCNIGFINPPYSMGSKTKNNDLYEINFISHLLDSVTKSNGKVVAIVPLSVVVGKTEYEKQVRNNILKRHTLEAVITLNKNTFYGVGTSTCIVIFTAWTPHDLKNHKVKFIDFQDDGYKVLKHRGLVKTERAEDRKQYLLEVYRNKIKAPNKFCIETTITEEDEWLHGFYYFNEEPPTEEEFSQYIGDALTFEVNMITHDRGYIFDEEKKYD